jgi:hypothetical protein
LNEAKQDSADFAGMRGKVMEAFVFQEWVAVSDFFVKWCGDGATFF